MGKKDEVVEVGLGEGAAVAGAPSASTAASPPSLAEKVEAAVNSWYHEAVHNSPISNDTRAWNYALEVKPILIRKVLEAVVS